MRADKRPQPCDVTVYSDKGSLALRFPKRHNALWEQLDGKSLNGKPKCLGIGKYGYKDNPDDWKRASQLAIAIEADLDHPEWEKLFDPTLAKYGLGGGKYAKLADVLQLPGVKQPEPEITVGEMWEDYLEWKQPQVQPTTFRFKFCASYTNVVKGLVWDKASRQFVNTGNSLWNLPLSEASVEKVWQHPSSKDGKSRVLLALSEAFTRLQALEKTKLIANPFAVTGGITENKTDRYKAVIKADGGIDLRWWDREDTETDPDERDRRAFTKDERDTIIKAFYGAQKASHKCVAPLIEFMFLTGCRSGEACALEWKDVFLGKNKEYIRFSKSYNGALKNTQTTKTGETRLFKIYPKLVELLNRIKPVDSKPTDLVFRQANNKPYYQTVIAHQWRGQELNRETGKYRYPGIVTQLIQSGAISCYLSPYHTRHTFITLQAHAGTDLLLLATACGNSVEVIQRHYLGIDTTVKMTDI